MKRTGKEISEAVFDAVTEISNLKREIFKIQADAENKIKELAKKYETELNMVRANTSKALQEVISSVSEKKKISEKHLKNVMNNN